MKIIIVLLLAGLPAAAHAGWMGGGMGHGCGHCGGHAATALYAALAALGYLVFQHSARETAERVRRTGAVVGMTLVIIGLLGFLCGAGSHMRSGMSRCRGYEGQGMMMGGGIEGKMGEMPIKPENIKVTATSGKKTK